MKEDIPYMCTPITSEDLRKISWKSNQEKASQGKEKTPIYK